MANYYEILRVSRNATLGEIKNAFKELALKFHPDKNNSLEAKEKFQEINEAYRILSDAELRKKYDREKSFNRRNRLKEKNDLIKQEAIERIEDKLTRNDIKVEELEEKNRNYEEEIWNVSDEEIHWKVEDIESIVKENIDEIILNKVKKTPDQGELSSKKSIDSQSNKITYETDESSSSESIEEGLNLTKKVDDMKGENMNSNEQSNKKDHKSEEKKKELEEEQRCCVEKICERNNQFNPI